MLGAIHQHVRGLVKGRPFGVVSVTDYGAKGDGSTDDTTAIQAAVDAVTASDEPGILRFAPGTYKITSTINIVGDRVTIEGAGSRRTIIDNQGSSYALRYNTATTPYRFNNVLRDIGITGGGTTEGGVYLYYLSQFHMSNIEMWNLGGKGVYAYEAHNVTIDGATRIRDCGGYGIHGSRASHAWKLDNLAVTGNDINLVFDDTARTVQVAGGAYEQATTGGAKIAGSCDVEFTSVYFESNSGYDLSVGDSGIAGAPSVMLDRCYFNSAGLIGVAVTGYQAFIAARLCRAESYATAFIQLSNVFSGTLEDNTLGTTPDVLIDNQGTQYGQRTHLHLGSGYTSRSFSPSTHGRGPKTHFQASDNSNQWTLFEAVNASKGTFWQVTKDGTVYHKPILKANLPAAGTVGAGHVATVSDPAAGKSNIVYSDGTDWLYMDGSTV